MPESVAVRSPIKVIVNASHLNGICVECNSKMEVKDYKLPLPEAPSGTTYYCDGCERNHFRTSAIGKLHDSEARDYNRCCLNQKTVKRAICPKCSGMTGQLIAKPTSIQSPAPPACISFRCLWKFVMDSLFVAYLSSYHRRRVAYAEANRPEKGKVILERYRTGTPAPKTLWQAIHANIKLTCPICRKYNVDPFLFANK